MSLSFALERLEAAATVIRTLMERLCVSIVVHADPSTKIAAATPLGEISIGCEQLGRRQQALGWHEPRLTTSAAVISAPLARQTVFPPLEKVLAESETALDRLLASGDVFGLRTVDAPSHIVLAQLKRSIREYQSGPAGALLRTCTDWAAPLRSGIPAIPSRPEFIERPTDARPWRSLSGTAQGRAQILHDMYVDIEISAMEVCARNVLNHPQMPTSFVSDMSRQIWDECRHAAATLERCRALGGPEGGAFYSLKLHHRWAAGDDLVTRLFIEQLVQEGNSLDSVAQLAQLFGAAGDPESQDILAFLAADEELHAWIGNRWALELLAGDLDEYRRKLLEAARIVGVEVPGPSRVAVERRIRAGFPAAVISDMYESQQLIGRTDGVHLARLAALSAPVP
jgi:uncharacterized ferritin-like protein (DUF455 family)